MWARQRMSLATWGLYPLLAHVHLFQENRSKAVIPLLLSWDEDWRIGILESIPLLRCFNCPSPGQEKVLAWSRGTRWGSAGEKQARREVGPSLGKSLSLSLGTNFRSEAGEEQWRYIQYSMKYSRYQDKKIYLSKAPSFLFDPTPQEVGDVRLTDGPSFAGHRSNQLPVPLHGKR
jgi:hypothetical protein